MTDSRTPANSTFAHNLTAFLSSPAAGPVSSNPARSAWATPAGRSQQYQMWNAMMGPGPQTDDFVELFIYNKSRDRHRICPQCRLAYTAPLPNVDRRTQQEQVLAGICSLACYRFLNRGMNEEMFGGTGDATQIEVNTDNKTVTVYPGGDTGF